LYVQVERASGLKKSKKTNKIFDRKTVISRLAKPAGRKSRGMIFESIIEVECKRAICESKTSLG